MTLFVSELHSDAREKPVRGCRLKSNHQFARSLAGYWIMNEGAGDVLNDLSPYRNHCQFPTDSADKPSWEVDQSVGVKFHGQIIGFDDSAGQRCPLSRDQVLTQGHAGAIWFYRTNANNRDSVVLGGTDGSAVLNYIIYIAGSGSNVNISYRTSGGNITVASGYGGIGSAGDPHFLGMSQDEDGNVELFHGEYDNGDFASIGTGTRTGTMTVSSICNYDSTTQQRAGFLHFWAAAMWNRPVTAREFESMFHCPWQAVETELEPIIYGPEAVAPAGPPPLHALMGVGV